MAEIRSSTLADGVYSFEAATENGTLITLSQSQIVAMGTSYSNAWGKILSFAVSPVGVMLIAVVPCLVIIIIELSKFIGKAMPQPEIETVKKQMEIPSYTPENGRAGAVRAYKNAGSSLDDSIGFYDSAEKNGVLEISSQPDTPLFLGPKHRPVAIQKKQQTEQMPLSQKKLNEAIAAARAEREMHSEMERAVKEIQKTRGAAISAEKEQEDYFRDLRNAQSRRTPEAAPKPAPASPRMSAPRINDTSKIQPTAEKKSFTPEFTPSRPVRQPAEDESVKQYTPKRQLQNATHVTTSIPRLDALLNEDVDGDSYNIDDILASLDKR